MMMQAALKQVGLDRLKRGSLCVFAGAGISFRSGVPVVYHIKRFVVDRICDDEGDRELLLSNRMPFEAFMEILFNNYKPPLGGGDNEQEKIEAAALLLAMAAQALQGRVSNNLLHSRFFQLFGSPRYLPNANHYLIAELLEKGICRLAVTTNFDTLIEKAYKERTGKELRVYFPENGARGRYDTPCLLKVHGGCQNIGSIQTTLDKIATAEAMERCRGMVEYAFATGKHTNVLVLGYSFSDIFDITPAIAGVRKSNKNVVNINHDSGPVRVAPLGGKQPIFQNLKGWQVEADTDEVVRALWAACAPGTPPGQVPYTRVDLGEMIGGWAENLQQPHQRLLLCGLFMVMMDKPDRAMRYFERCLETEEVRTNDDYKRMILQNLTISQARVPKATTQSLENLLKSADAFEQVKYLVNMVSKHLLAGDLAAAEAACGQGLEIARKAGDRRSEGLCHASHAHVLNEKREHARAAEAAERALELFEGHDDLETQRTRCRVYCYLATAHDRLGHPGERQKNLDRGRELAEKLGAESEIASMYFSLGNAVDTEADRPQSLRKAIDYFKMGHAFCAGETEEKHFIMPMLRDSAFFILAANIIDLWREDRQLVTEEELALAYTLIADEYANNRLGNYGSVAAEVAGCMCWAAMAQTRFDEALEVVLEKLASSQREKPDADLRDRMLLLLALWFEEQEKRASEPFDFENALEPLQQADASLDRANEAFGQPDYAGMAAALAQAFVIIPANCSFRDHLPFRTYRRIANLRSEVVRYVNERSATS